MKLGMVFYRHQLNRENLLFAKQLGCTHVVAHLVDYFNNDEGIRGPDNQPIGDLGGWGVTRNRQVWTLEELQEVKDTIESHGLIWEALENFDPGFWFDIVLDGPRKSEQIDGLKTLIRRLGKVGVKVMGYNFSVAGVAGRITGNFARGGAEAVGCEGIDDIPVPNGMFWNMVYDPELLKKGGNIAEITHEQLWQRLEWFLKELVPVAEEAGVKLALHPDDPPFESVRGTPRLVHRPEMYQRVLDIYHSKFNAIECCIGTLGEMQGDFYEPFESYARNGALGYIHLRNVRGKVPKYHEVFIDEGDIDIAHVVRILAANKFDGVIVPDHTPMVSGAAPWHIGMAYALGYIKALIQQFDC